MNTLLSKKKGLSQRGLFFVVLLASIAGICACPSNSIEKNASIHTGFLKTPLPPPPVKDSLKIPIEQATPLISIIGVGDMMLGTSYPSESYLPANGGSDLLKETTPILKDADLTFGNLEGAILDTGGTAKQCSNPAVCYVFRSPEKYVQHFVNAGFDVLSIANNHSGDFGPVGRKRTKEVLDQAGIQYAGLAGTDEWTVTERNGTRFGLAAFAPNSGTCDIRNLSRAKEIVSALKDKCDIIIVSFHGGAEGASHQHVTNATETYYGENRGNVVAFAHAVIDAGADVVFGHGPHVTRAMELYKDRFIIYSLGNFCTYGRFSLDGPAGIAPIIKLQVARDGTFAKGAITPVFQKKTHGPRIDPAKQAIKKLKELTLADFPDTKLAIDDNGAITKLN